MKFIKQSIIIAALFTVATVNAAPATTNEHVEIAERVMHPFNHFAGKKNSKKLQSAFPSKYDLRNVDGMNFISPVKNQGRWGTCWSFATMSASEASAQYELYKEYGITPEEMPLDFSELQIAWFAYTALQKHDPDYPKQSGEGLHFDKDFKILDRGGHNYLSTALLASGIGPFDESEIPYTNKSGNILWVKVDENGKEIRDENNQRITEVHPADWNAPSNFRPFAYSVNDGEDWSVDMKKRFNQKLRLQHASSLPSPALLDYTHKEYAFDVNGVNAIKQELLDGRAVEISFHADNSRIDDDRFPPTYINKNWAHYTYDVNRSNHAVTVVGYDDKFPAEKFEQRKGNETFVPPGNGAFLVKNSWGHKDDKFFSNWGIDGTGYFYLSYYDKSLSDPTTYDFSVMDILDDNTVRTIDQHDLLPAHQGWDVYRSSEEIRMGNVFKVKSNEILDGISTFVFIPGATVEYEVYLINKKKPLLKPRPNDGTLVAKGSKRYEYAGFHLIDLEEPITFKKNQSYSIVIKQKDDDGFHYFGFAVDYSKNTYKVVNKKEKILPYYATTVVNQGESYIYDAKKGWRDERLMLNYYQALDIELEEGKVTRIKNGIAMDNFPIKGYAKMVKKN